MKIDKVNDALIVLGAYIGLSQIETILGVIILSFQILLIIYKGVFKIIEKIKNKQYKEISTDIQEITEELDKLRGGNNE